MKKTIYSITFLLASLCFMNCSDSSTSEEFEDVNGDIKDKLIQSISVISPQELEEEVKIDLVYNTDGSLSTINDGEDLTLFVYEGTELVTITGGGSSGSSLNSEEFSGSPYDAFGTGDVKDYDDNGNPIEIVFFEEGYDYNSNEYTTHEFTAIVSYDDAPNAYYATLKAAGIIDILDGIELNFGLNMQSSELIKAKQLLPMNNISRIEYRNELGELDFTVDFNYVYDEDNYPTSATIRGFSVDGSDDSSVLLTYTYVD